jgi:uncharacterized protein (TIGR01244 family)
MIWGAVLAAALSAGACGGDAPTPPVQPPNLAQSAAEPKENAMFRTLTDDLLVSPQISVADVAAAKAQGVTLIINNRPDGESDDQTPGDEIKAAAEAAGITYVAIPVTHAGFSAAQIDALDAALNAKGAGKTLAYCRSGTRSTLLWSLRQARSGMSPDEIARTAAGAGYDVMPIRAMLDSLAGQASD